MREKIMREKDGTTTAGGSTTPSDLETQNEGIVASLTSDNIPNVLPKETITTAESTRPPTYDGNGLPIYNDAVQPESTPWYSKLGLYIRPHGESGREGFHPWKFCVLCFRSSCPTSKLVNRFWVLVPTAFVMVSTLSLCC
jgi:hypothetical protein